MAEFDDLRACLAGLPVFAGRPLDDLRVEPLPSLTNRTYKITLAEGAYVLRIAGQGTERFVNRAREHVNARQAFELGIGPEILHFDETTGLMVTRWLPHGEPLDRDDFAAPAVIAAAARLLRRLHDSGRHFSGERHLLANIEEYLALADARRQGSSDVLSRLQAVWQRERRKRPAFEAAALPLAPCHIDPVPANFVRVDGDGRLYLVDWEYAAMAEPMWDVAAVSVEAEFSEAQDGALLKSYFGPNARAMTARFLDFKALLHLLASAWAVLRSVEAERRAEFLAMADERLARYYALRRR